MTTFVDEHRTEYGVEPICAELPIAHQPITSTNAANANRPAGQPAAAATRS